MAVVATKAERHARGFTCWGQIVAMLFCQLGRAYSLREICGGLASCEGRLAHIDVTAPSRATLADANLIALLRMNLFVYRDVWVWLNDPFTSPPLPPESAQVTLAWV